MRKSLLFSLAFGPVFLFAQEDPETRDWGTLSGNFQFDGQYYVRDTRLDPSGEFYPEEQFLGQGFANFNYIRGNFRAGIRYENYQNPLLGFPPGYRGEGITYRYVQFVKDGLDVTVGNFYEQFGSGMLFRAYEERNLGYDNVMDGVRLKYSPINGMTFKGVLGKQRKYFEKSEGIVRGIDGEFRLNDLFTGMSEMATHITIGGSFVSKYQPANDPFLNLPENVGAGGGRISLSRGKVSLDAEYVFKANDPSEDNGYIFRPGQGLLINFTYATRGFGLIFSAKRIDNMSFRSERGAQQNDVLINFLPPTTKFHTYALPALYPYQTVLNGEQGFQTEMTYLFPRGSILGGKYGTNLAVNFAYAGSLYKEPIPKTDTLNYVQNGYNTEWFKQG
ncbi:MAG: DUF6029 family protein, partial [Bacteroidota bacterium]|nr:DUF6029 family protein [Bacteroidota bacterium]MDX5448857.1 DUF6029 family protein [Bacteroidota bacterium]